MRVNKGLCALLPRQQRAAGSPPPRCRRLFRILGISGQGYPRKVKNPSSCDWSGSSAVVDIHEVEAQNWQVLEAAARAELKLVRAGVAQWWTNPVYHATGQVGLGPVMIAAAPKIRPGGASDETCHHLGRLT